jgi:hypothetical protein
MARWHIIIMEFQGAIDISKGTPNFNPDTSVESQLNNGTALGPLPGSGKLGGNIDLKKLQTTSSV